MNATDRSTSDVQQRTAVKEVSGPYRQFQNSANAPESLFINASRPRFTFYGRPATNGRLKYTKSQPFRSARTTVGRVRGETRRLPCCCGAAFPQAKEHTVLSRAWRLLINLPAAKQTKTISKSSKAKSNMQPPSTPRKLCVVVAPVSPLAKCMSRKRVRTCAQPEHEEDELAFVDEEAVGCENDLEEAYVVMTPSKRARPTVSEDIASLKVSVRQVEAQVAEACAAMQELRSLVKLLAVQRQSATTCA